MTAMALQDSETTASYMLYFNFINQIIDIAWVGPLTVRQGDCQGPWLEISMHIREAKTSGCINKTLP